MKILIITYSREVNPGTFLQAFGVQYAFKELFPHAKIDLLKHKRLYPFIGQTKEINSCKEKKDRFFWKEKLAAIPRRLKYEYEYRHNFHFTESEFDLFNYNKREFCEMADKYDLIVVGSDTILVNLKQGEEYGLMWLENIKTNKLLFAASAAPAKFLLTEDDVARLNKSFSTFIQLGVRDDLSYKLLTQTIGMKKEVIRQPDPTFLIPIDFFTLPMRIKRKLLHIRKHQKVVLVNFGNRFYYKSELTQLLKKKGYYTVATLYNKDADCNLMTLSAFEWAALFQYIDITITERFHDSVFTLRNNKPVIAIDWDEKRISDDGFSKTSDLLNHYGLDKMHFSIQKNDKSIQKVYKIINDIESLYSLENNSNINELTRVEYKYIIDQLIVKLKSSGLPCSDFKL